MPGRQTRDNPAPTGRCTCQPDAEGPCEYCWAMALWSHEELYGPNSLAPDPEYGVGRGEPEWDWDWDAEEDDA